MIMLPALVVIAQLQITAQDVPQIVEAVLEASVPADARLSGRLIGERPIYLDTDQTIASLRDDLTPEVSGVLTPETVGRSFVARAEEDAVRCVRGTDTTGPRSCSIPNDGIFVSVLEAGPTEDPDEYRLKVRVLWVEHEHDRGVLVGYDMEMFVSEVGAEEGQENGTWEVVRKGLTIVG